MYRRKVGLLSLCLCACLVQSFTGLERQCDASMNGPNVRVVVNSQRNQTGHWISKVSLQHKSDHNNQLNQMKPWIVEVEENASSCSGGASYLDVTMTLTARPPTVGPDYKLFPGVGYYKFHSDVTNWPRAREICAEEGAHLVIINSQEEVEVIKKLFIPYPTVKGAVFNDYASIGVYRKSVTSDWITVLGDLLDSTGYKKWAGPSNPKPEAVHDVVLVLKTDGSLHNNRRDLNNSFICEQELW